VYVKNVFYNLGSIWMVP